VNIYLLSSRHEEKQQVILIS